VSEEGKKAVARLRLVLNDAFAFVRSAELNKELSSVTIEDLMSELIARNGESDKSKSGEYNPYSTGGEETVASEDTPETQTPVDPGNYITGTEALNPTKMDRLMALKDEIADTVAAVKAYDPSEIADAEDYTDAETVSVSFGDVDEEEEADAVSAAVSV
jgi:hypothetical protein